MKSQTSQTQLNQRIATRVMDAGDSLQNAAAMDQAASANKPVGSASTLPAGLSCGSRDARDALRLAVWPWPDGPNRYQSLFYEALGPDIQITTDFDIHDDVLRAHADQLDAIHFHWPEEAWRKRGKTLSQALRGVGGFWKFLQLAHTLGLRIIWTAHNLAHHEGAGPIDRLGYQALGWHSDLVICHSGSAASALKRRMLIRGQLVVMPIGNYDGVFPTPNPREATLRQWGLDPERPVVCCVGAIRRYKGVELAIDAIARLDRRVQLVVAGRPTPDTYGAEIQHAVHSSNTGAVLTRPLDQQEFADLVTASAAVLLPYRKITGSAALMAAWTLSRGVVAADLPYFREMCKQEPRAAALFKRGSARALSQAIASYLEQPAEQRATAARRLADQYSWKNCVAPVAACIDNWPMNETHTPSTTREH